MSDSLRIEVRTGEAERQRVDFSFGTPTDPFGVGTNASWVVRADGVAELHAYLYFDGATLFVTSVGGAPVTMGGHSVGGGWEPVEVPMNIHLGGAKLAVRAPSTHRTGAAEPTTRKKRAEIAVPDADDEKTRFQPVPAAARAESAQAAAFEPPSDSEATVVRAPDFEPAAARSPKQQERPRPPGGLESVPESERTRFAPVEARLPTGGPAAATPAAASPAAGAPPGPASGEPDTRRAPLPAAGAAPPGMAWGTPAAPGATPGMPGRSPQGVAPQMGPAAVGPGMAPGAPPGMAGQPVGRPPAGAPPGQSPSASASPAREKARELALKAREQWREATMMQRVILIMMPFVFVAAYYLFQTPEPEATPAPSASAPAVASAAPSQSAAPRAKVAAKPPQSASASPSATPSAPPTAARHPPAKAVKGKTEQRAAVDAVAAGDYKKALELYKALAAAHPDKPAYKESVEILRKKLEAR